MEKLTKPLKILVSGSVEGAFDALFGKINSVQKKAGPFDMLFCVGDFFGPSNAEWGKYLSGASKVPLPTFIIGPSTEELLQHFPDPNGCELFENVTYLGHKGVYMTTTGLEVAYLSGTETSTVTKGDITHFDSDTAQALRTPLLNESNFKGIDLLLTSQWPKGVEKYGSATEGVNSSDIGSAVVTQLALSLKPRYHFTTHKDVYYERQPYRNHKVLQEGAQHVTRFISLANVKSKGKKKFLYAFTITPLLMIEESQLVKQPEDATESPYKLDNSVFKKNQKEETGAQFFYDPVALEKGNTNYKEKGGRKRGHDGGDGPREKKPSIPKGPCWFCLGSPEVEKHLVVSVGMHSYLALAKGGLTPDHLLILPIAHFQAATDLPDEILQEVQQYKNALKKCFKSQGKAVVFFERNFKSHHMQVQVVPIDSELVPEIKETFQGCALSQDCELHEIPEHTDLKQVVPPGAPYFYVELPTNEKLLHRVKKISPISLQLGREAMSHPSLLNMPERADWRNCKCSQREEEKMRDSFRKVFQPYDFNDV